MLAVATHFRAFAHKHDDIPAFHAAYVVGTFLAASIFNLGFFFVMILAHMALDFFKYREVHDFPLVKTMYAIFVESMVDIAFFLIALTFAVYLNHTYALAAFSGLVRSELTLVRAVGTILPKIQIFENMLTLVLNVHSYLHSVHPSIDNPFTRAQRWALRSIIVCIALLVLCVFLFRGDETALLNVIVTELKPSL